MLATKKEIDLTTLDLEKRLERWRDLQATFMPSVKEVVLRQDPSSIDTESLYLPSHFRSEGRVALELQALGKEEEQLREAEVFECLAQLRHSAKRLSTMADTKKKNVWGQSQSTRAWNARKSVLKEQATLLKIYTSARKALLELSDDKESTAIQFPALTLDDLSRKSTVDKRQLGDSHRSEGAVWTAGIPRSYRQPQHAKTVGLPSDSSGHASHQKPMQHASVTGSSSSNIRPPVAIEGGALWQAKLGLSDNELEEWDKERKCSILTTVLTSDVILTDDRVQWFRTWASMMRWLEEFEMKHIEFMRCIQHFRTMHDIWKSLSDELDSPGDASFARRQSTIFMDLCDDAQEWFREVAEPQFLDLSEGNLVSKLQEFRKQELGWLSSYAGPDK